jgi:oxalate decarboxylase
MSHKTSFRTTPPQISNDCGVKTAINKSNFPILNRLAIYRLTLNPRCFREPHWHANADELSYCLKGTTLVTIFASGNQHSQFTISEGEMFFAPSGSLHAIENIGDEPAEFLITFSHEMPEDFGISGFAGCLDSSVLGNTWGLAATDISGVTRSPIDIQIGRANGAPLIPEQASYPNALKFPIESRPPLLSAPVGSAIVARRDTWPALKHQAMYSLRLQGIGMREPHWHPETSELGFVHTGRARMTVQSPGGSAETYELEPSDVYFIPRAYPHHIENLTDSELRFLIFFDTPDVQDIGFTGAIPAFSDRMTGPSLGLSADQIARIPKQPADLLIVSKTNPVFNRP